MLFFYYQGGVSPLSFKEALLAAIPAAPVVASSAPAASASHNVAPRILLRQADSRPPPPTRGPDAEGWLEAESRHSRKARQRAERGPRRRVPSDLRGRCFNCFSPGHRAAACYSRTRCFTCHRLGHRALRCPNSSMAVRPTAAYRLLAADRPRVAVWRRRDAGPDPAAAGGSDGVDGVPASTSPPASGALASDPPLVAACTTGADGAHGTEGRRRRRRVRRRRAARRNESVSPPPENSGLPPPAVPASGAAGDIGAGAATRPRRIIDRSERIARAEEDLRCALSVLLVGDPSAVSVEGLVAELARRFDLPASSIQPHRLKPNELLLVVSSEDEAIRIHNDGRPIQLGQLTLHCRRWSRFRNATGVSLPQLVDVEICGIPAHVWELDTAEHLLDEWCWVRALHPDTIHRRDYSTFRLSTWCSNPAMIPAAMDLVVVEPPVPVEEAPPLKRGLSYEVHIAVRPDEVQTLDVGAPPAPPPTGHDGRRRRRRRSRSPDSSPKLGGRVPCPRRCTSISGACGSNGWGLRHRSPGDYCWRVRPGVRGGCGGGCSFPRRSARFRDTH